MKVDGSIENRFVNSLICGTLSDPVPPILHEEDAELIYNVSSFSLHAGVSIKGNHRNKLENLYRYISRPALSAHRLSITSDGKIRYELRKNGFVAQMKF